MHERKIAHTGFHAEIFRGQLPDSNEYLSKHYGKKSQRGFEPPYAMELIRHMRTFVAKADAIGIPIAVPFGYYVENNHVPGLVNLVEAVRTVGPDLREIILDPQTTDRQVIGYLREYLSLFRASWKSGFAISLDPPPANFCIGKNKKLHFIDCMPPRQKLGASRMLSEMPDPPENTRAFIEARYFSPLQARVIYAQLLRTLADRVQITPQVVKELIKKELGREAYDAISIDDQTKRRVCAHPQSTDVDILRILAAEALYERKITKDELAVVYKAAHIDTGGILPEAKTLVQAARILKKVCL